MALVSPLVDLERASADPARVAGLVERLTEARPDAAARLRSDPELARVVVAVAAASAWLGRLVLADPAALDVLGDLDRAVDVTADDPPGLARWRHLEHLRIAGRDLTGRDTLETTLHLVTAMATEVVDRALGLAGATGVAVIAMGKAGGDELNYASDVDVVLVGDRADPTQQRAARRFLEVARAALRIDVDLRPEGRDGPLVRTVDGYRSHWARWAEPWERQALLKAHPMAGPRDLGRAFAAAAADELWERGFGADAIHQVRAMKERTERHASAGRSAAGDIKRTPGGLRDIEFSAQLLQLVHGPLDPSLRVRGTLPSLDALVGGGYVDRDDAAGLGAAYRFLRRLEHAVQLDEDRQVHAVPHARSDRIRLARVLGFVDTPRRSALESLDAELAACRSRVRTIHERIYFRPLLDAFVGVDAPLGTEAAATRLVAFGFADAERTRQAVTELTRGLTRTSRLMAQMLPLLLDWLSVGPDPDRGLLALRTLVAGHAPAVTAAFRDSPASARRLCQVAATSPPLIRALGHAPDLLRALGEPLPDASAVEHRLVRIARSRPDADQRRAALRHGVRQEQARVGVADVLDEQADVDVGRSLAGIARGAVRAAVALADPRVPVAVLTVGRLAGGRLGYGSDLDLLLAHGAEDEAGRQEAARAGEAIRRVLLGTGPADRIFDVDLDLRPGGRSSPLVQGRAGIAEHVERWAEPWNRLALSRLRPLAGDLDLAEAVVAAVAPTVWRPLEESDLRSIRRVKARAERERIPAGDDPTFHLKLGPGALTDIELTVGLLLLVHSIRQPAVAEGILALRDGGHLTAEEADDLAAAHAFCDRTRNRSTLIAGGGRQSLPTGEELATLARSLGTTGPQLRDRYLRLTRRARRVVLRRFYGQDD